MQSPEVAVPKVDPELLEDALGAALAGRPDLLAAFLRAHSNLPGPRGNLELAGQFAGAVAARAGGAVAEAVWQVVRGLAGVGPAEAPTGDPGEFLAFCGTVGAASFMGDPARRPAIWEIVRRAAEDERWRLREAAAQAIQRGLPADPSGALALLGEWAAAGSWLLCRGAAAGLADPALLRGPGMAAAARQLHEVILARFTAAADRRDPAFQVLRQGLGYTVSVVVAADPGPGFAWLRRLAAIPDGDLARVLLSNLGKGRLARAHADEVEEVRALLGG